jgi:hypothetical protein
MLVVGSCIHPSRDLDGRLDPLRIHFRGYYTPNPSPNPLPRAFSVHSNPAKEFIAAD